MTRYVQYWFNATLLLAMASILFATILFLTKALIELFKVLFW